MERTCYLLIKNAIQIVGAVYSVTQLTVITDLWNQLFEKSYFRWFHIKTLILLSFSKRLCFKFLFKSINKNKQKVKFKKFKI